MDVPNERKEIFILVAENGFVSVFKQVPASVMEAIKILGIPRQKFSHDRGNALPAALKQDVHVIAHEDPGVDRALALSYILC
jgi:hypothetical protein